MSRATILIGTVVSFCLATSGWCAKTWDAGESIDGTLEDKEIEIACSTQEEGPSTDALSVDSVEDLDHWINPEESTPDEEGDDADDIGGFGELKCWWTASAGSVSQYSFTTTWTAPYDQGTEAHIEIGVIDLPKTIDAIESGTRDDEGRAYIGTDQINRAKGYKVTLHINTSGPTHGNPQEDFNQTTAADCGDGKTLGIVDPDDDNCDGFHKKVEIVGVMSPVKAGLDGFVIHQWRTGSTRLNDGYSEQPVTDAPDTGTEKQETPDAVGKIFYWDAPGVKITGGGWGKNAGDTLCDFNWTYTNKVFFNGRLCSNVLDWTRRVKLTGVTGQNQWNKPADKNE